MSYLVNCKKKRKRYSAIAPSKIYAFHSALIDSFSERTGIMITVATFRMSRS